MPSLEHNEIQKWFLNQSDQIKKEKVIGRHRPDLILNNILIEIQCTSISFKNYESRNRQYLELGYYPIWVFGKDYYEHARTWQRYGQHINRIENIEFNKHGTIFFHNKYNLFSSIFKYKHSFKNDITYSTVGWYKINGPLNFVDFWGIVNQRLKKSVI